MRGELLNGGDSGCLRAGESGRAEPELPDVHGRPRSDDAVADELDIARRCRDERATVTHDLGARHGLIALAGEIGERPGSTV